MEELDTNRKSFFLATVLLLSVSPFLSSQDSSANVSSSWINHPRRIDNGIAVYTSWSAILLRESSRNGRKFACSFYCKNTDDECVFGVLIFPSDGNFTSYNFFGSPELVWSANRNSPVGINATLQLRQDGDLVLENGVGDLVWSSKTSGKSVSGLNLTEDGNLVLFGRNKEPVWQSFDYPTDSLVLGQRLIPGRKLTANVSVSEFGSGLFSLSVDKDRLVAYVESNPPQIYYASVLDDDLSYVEFANGSFGGLSIPLGSVDRFMKLGVDGRLKVYQFTGKFWTEVADLFKTKLGDCGLPMVCGSYGVCSNGNCRCPEISGNDQRSFFKQTDYWKPNLGCSLATPFSCSHSRKHVILELKNASYFAFEASFVNMVEVKSVEDCKTMCLNNCSCKAALFVSGSKGRCLVLNEVFSIISKENNTSGVSNYDTTVFLKVQNAQASKREKKVVIIVASTIATFLVFASVILSGLVRRKRRLKEANEFEEGFLDRALGMPTSYSYQDLKAMTEDFSHKLGEGGFGCVYEGTLGNGRKVAVKRLNLIGLNQTNDSFIVEVETIGNIHHANLVSLIGFCFKKSHRLLIYEHMANGSLDRWIFEKDQSHSLPWETRQKIILDVAKGLAYLHEECSQKIIHFDIKPQNILLDQNFNAKVADFGLSKLIDKDQSRVVTRMRGTPGYLAPEWLNSVITEKVDVYSFGILILEIVCGRRNLDWLRDEEDRHLLELFKLKAEAGELQDLVDEKIKDHPSHVEVAEEVMKIAAWCLQSDFTKRPAMSLVVKVLEDMVVSEKNMDYDFIHHPLVFRTLGVAHNPHVQKASDSATPILPSALSGPR